MRIQGMNAGMLTVKNGSRTKYWMKSPTFFFQRRRLYAHI